MRRFSGLAAGLMIAGMIWSGCGEEGTGDTSDRSGGEETEETAAPQTGPGGIVLADGYEHVFTGDSASNSGRISKSPTPTIVYTIGGHTGNFVHELSTDRGLTPETREEGDRTFHIVRHNGLIYVTVTHEEAGKESKEYPANFQGPVTDEEAEEVIDMVMTYNP